MSTLQPYQFQFTCLAWGESATCFWWTSLCRTIESRLFFRTNYSVCGLRARNGARVARSLFHVKNRASTHGATYTACTKHSRLIQLNGRGRFGERERSDTLRCHRSRWRCGGHDVFESSAIPSQHATTTSTMGTSCVVDHCPGAQLLWTDGEFVAGRVVGK